MKATFLTLWTQAHQIQKLTAMQIPLLCNWMRFSLLVTSEYVWLSETQVNEL